MSQPGAIRKPARRRRAASSPDATGDILRMALLTVICICVWCTVYDRWSGGAWNLPVEYGLNPAAADVKGEFAAIKAAAEGDFTPALFHNLGRLNAPYIANWNDYPSTEDFMYWGAGVLSHVIGFFPATNLLLLVVQVLAAPAFYYAARRLKVGWQWAFAGGLLYANAPFAYAHSLHHVVITAYWHIPLALLVAFWVANGRSLRFGSRDFWFSIGVAVLTGLQNVYYTNAFIQLVGISLIIQWMKRGWPHWRACLPALSIGSTAFGVFFLMVVRGPVYALFHGHNTGAAMRSFGQMEFYALKLISFFIPFPTHKIPIFASLGKRYESWTILPAETPPACYFGLAALAAFVWLAVCTVRNGIDRDRRRIPLESVQALWLFLYATVGGFNAFIGVMRFQLFRSTTRFCIVIMAISLLFAARRLTLLARRWRSPWPMLAPVLVAVLGLAEFLPPTAGEDQRYVAAAVRSDSNFAQKLEARMPRGMIFQFPVQDFPETPIPGVSAYDHFRPYIFSNTLRFSFGDDKGRPDTAWQRTIVAMTPRQQVETLERYGFSGIYVNRMGYSDQGEAMLAQYKAADRADVIESENKDLYCVVLNPSSTPSPPPQAPFFSQGWYAEQDSTSGQRDHMASGDAFVQLTNPSTASVEKYAHFFVATVAPRTVTLQGGGAFQSWHVDQQYPARVVNLRLTLPPGVTALKFSTLEAATPQQVGMVTFDVVNFDLTDSPRPEQ